MRRAAHGRAGRGGGASRVGWAARVAGPWLGALLAAGATAMPASAATIASTTVTLATPAGSIELVSRIDDEVPGAPGRWRFEYSLSGSYDPLPGLSNGLSALHLVFAGPAFAEDLDAPAPWIVDCCLTPPPFGAGFDLPNRAGRGGPAVVSFTLPAGVPFTDVPSGSYAGSHAFDVPIDFVALVDATSGRGPLVPLPEPGALLLVGLGLAGLGARRRCAAGR